MSSVAKQLLLLIAFGSASASTPFQSVVQRPKHISIHEGPGQSPKVVAPHAKAAAASQPEFAKSDRATVKHNAKMSEINNGPMTANSVIKNASSKLGKVAVEKPAKVLVAGSGLARPTPAIIQGEHASTKALSLGKVAAAVNTSTSGANVWCGGEYAPNCAACPQGHGVLWCHGHCQWTGGQCILQGQPIAAKDVTSPMHKAPEVEPSRKTLPADLTGSSNTAGGSGPAPKLPWVRKNGPVPVIHQAKATSGMHSQASQPGVGHFLTAYKKEDECTCAFHGVCTCEASMQFMQCISKSCDAGCDCQELQYKDACHNLQSACGDMGLTFDCSTDKATCVAYEHTTTRSPPKLEKTVIDSRPLPYLNAPRHEFPVPFLYESLVEMKEDKCQLEAAVKDGLVNADQRLGLLVPQIEAKLGDLEAQCLKMPELRCDKDFEEFSGYPAGHRCAPKSAPAPKKSGGSSARLGLAVAAIFAAHVANP